MDFPNEIGLLGQNLQNYLIAHGTNLPEFTRDKVVEAVGSPSPVDRIVKVAEALYAAQGQLNAAGLTICAQLAQFAAINAWHGMSIENRGGRMAQAMLRELGEAAPAGTDWPLAENDPTPLPEYVEEVVE